ncbi:hypothetical protein F0L74_20285 [Chitinophaga agrisoli]|uniref:Uncharacterized protein n=1 Tax=Chitinophaga agrisoli TaxID=2607653 RepID=A0A5B2VI32_9BACT|nr:hypothetical protein [Chitinophaga agrisoli]KAA2238565.1 hypothetical protein F0L74_20285 [Chitinophaga agrisoli]
MSQKIQSGLRCANAASNHHSALVRDMRTIFSKQQPAAPAPLTKLDIMKEMVKVNSKTGWILGAQVGGFEYEIAHCSEAGKRYLESIKHRDFAEVLHELHLEREELSQQAALL